jgi:predicted metal-dependent hydrolase
MADSILDSILDIKLMNYLGKQYPVVVMEDINDSIEFCNDHFQITVKEGRLDFHHQLLIDHWYYEEANRIFVPILSEMIYKAVFSNSVIPKLQISKMDSRWGACAPAKEKIIINVNLVQTPRECIEYIILHEILHFKYPQHDLPFYSTLSRIMPDWKKRSSELDNDYSFVLKQ